MLRDMSGNDPVSRSETEELSPAFQGWVGTMREHESLGEARDADEQQVLRLRIRKDTNAPLRMTALKEQCGPAEQSLEPQGHSR